MRASFDALSDELGAYIFQLASIGYPLRPLTLRQRLYGVDYQDPERADWSDDDDEDEDFRPHLAACRIYAPSKRWAPAAYKVLLHDVKIKAFGNQLDQFFLLLWPEYPGREPRWRPPLGPLIANLTFVIDARRRDTQTFCRQALSIVMQCTKIQKLTLDLYTFSGPMLTGEDRMAFHMCQLMEEEDMALASLDPRGGPALPRLLNESRKISTAINVGSLAIGRQVVSRRTLSAIAAFPRLTSLTSTRPTYKMTTDSGMKKLRFKLARSCGLFHPSCAIWN
jgi:hypothetical protein